MDDFDKKRLSTFSKDKSKKGSIDRGIKELVVTLNGYSNLFTTSSCSGRVVVFKKIGQRKNELEFLFTSHEKLFDSQGLIDSISGIKGSEIWLLFNPAILHVCCKTIDDACWLISCARQAGYKRGGIISVKEMVMVEIIGTDYIEHLLADKQGVYYTDELMAALIKQVNERFDSNFQKISKLTEILKQKT